MNLRADFNRMVQILLQRERVATTLKLRPATFDVQPGDRVAFFHGERPQDFKFGHFIDGDHNTAHVIDDHGEKFRVSPISLFAPAV